MSSLASNAIGVAAAACSMSSFAPQLIKILKERDASAVSLKMFMLTVLAFTLWLVYGLLLRSWPLASSNFVCLCLSSAILAAKWRFSRHHDLGEL